MVMRKMLKRDAVTRLKALQEFKDFCSEKDFEVVKNVMPFWPRLFNRLALDTDRRIREATHLANGELISKIKREIAPYLKSIMGVWLLSQCDLYAPAASAAQATFAATFPTAKQSDALLHCKAEIFFYFKDNLFEQTAKTLSEPNSASPEDMENKYILVISGTLQALKLFMNIVERSEVEKLHEDFCSIIAEKRFWKFAKCKEAQIRGSWYALMSCLCQNIHGIFSTMENKLATTVFSSLSESDPIVAPSIWEAALSIVVNFENCWQEININKVVLPQLWSLLENGGKGNAQVLYPCLLPFLSKLPSEIIGNENIILKFFDSLKESLFLDNVKKSHIECDAILTALTECLQYICCVRIENLELSSSILKKVLRFHVADLIHKSLSTKDAHLATSKLYPLVGSLICKVECKCFTTKEVSECFSKAIEEFWEYLLPIFYEVLDSPLESSKSVHAMYLSYFFNSILVPTEALVKAEKPKVRFEDEVSEPESSNNSSIIRTMDPNSVILSNKKSQSFAHILKLSKYLCDQIGEKCDICYLNLLIEVLASVANGELLFELIMQTTAQKQKDVFYQDTIARWLEKTDNNLQKLNCIAELIFILCANSSEEEATKVWNSVCQVQNAALLQCLLSKGLSKYVDYPLFHQWIQGTVFITNVEYLLIQCLEDILNKDSISENDLNPVLNVFKICMKANLFESNNLLHNTHLKHVIQSLKEFADKILAVSTESPNFKIGLNFLCDVGTSIVKNSMICWDFRDITELIFALFHHNLTNKKSLENLTNFWCTAVECYIQSKPEIVHDNSLILKIASDLHSNILCLTSLDKSMRVLDHYLLLLSSVQDSLNCQKSTLQYSGSFALSKLIDAILPTEEEWQLLRKDHNFSTVPLFLEKKLFYPLLMEESFFPSGDIHKGLLSVYVVSKIILKELQREDSFVDEKFLESCVIKHFPHTLWFSTFYEETSAADVLNEELSSLKISEDSFKMLTFLPKGINDIMNKILTETLNNGCFWAVPLHFLMKHFNLLQTENIPLMIEERLKDENLSENLHKSVLQQIVIPYLSIEKQQLQFKLTLYQLAQIREISNKNFAEKLGEICCYLQNEDLSLSTDLQNLLAETICKVIEYNFPNDNMKFSYHLQVVAVLSSVVNCGANFFNETILNYLGSTMKSLSQKQFLKKFENPAAVLKAYQTFEAFSTMSIICNDQESSKKEDVKKQLVLDDECYTNIVSLYLYVTNMFNEMKPLPSICCNMLLSVSEAMKFLPSNSLGKMIDKSTEIPRIRDNTILQSLISSLTFSNRQIQFTSHSLLMKIMRSLPDMLLNSENFLSDEDKDEDIEKIPNCASPLIKLLVFLTEIIDSMLLDFKIGDLCSVLPGTDSYIYTMAYLLSWIEMLEFISSSPSQVRSIYAAHLEESKLLSELFSNVFRLMPSNPVACIVRSQNVSTPKKEDLKLLFTQPPVLNLDFSSSEDIQRVASYVYATVLRRVPASIRTWWNNLDRKSSDIVNKFTTKYISGLLCIEEIQAVHESEKNFENMVVQARPGSREVIATYTIDDCAIELSVQLPVNYPLGPISAERRGKIVIGQLEWRHWLMQLTTVLRYQNGSILDGLNIWKRNLDKKFEGVEECMICYYVLHSSTLKLPKLSCRVCKKKFHSACLYKWFDTSYNSTCPLCRNEFFIPMQKT
uniref:E3 ubiquitin-protein ligase listerin n=1 Tax=Parasteatoda tepidariorum TaxID=114398 RepID=A0A2L2Y589_PARTP